MSWGSPSLVVETTGAVWLARERTSVDRPHGKPEGAAACRTVVVARDSPCVQPLLNTAVAARRAATAPTSQERRVWIAV